MKRRPRRTNLHPETVLGVAGDGVLSLLYRVPHTHSRSSLWVAHQQLRSCLPPYSAPSGPFQQAHACQLVAIVDVRRWSCLEEEEREMGKGKRKRVKGGERETGIGRKIDEIERMRVMATRRSSLAEKNG